MPFNAYHHIMTAARQMKISFVIVRRNSYSHSWQMLSRQKRICNSILIVFAGWHNNLFACVFVIFDAPIFFFFASLKSKTKIQDRRKKR